MPVKSYVDEVIEYYDNEIERAVQKACYIVEADAKRDAPVDTGRLRASIRTEVERISKYVVEGKIGTNVEYSRYVELGTSRQSPQPYLRPALRNNFAEIVAIIQGAVR